MLAAVASIAVFGLICVVMIERSDLRRIQTAGEVGRVRALAAADAGVALAIHSLLRPAASGAPSIDGTPQRRRYGTADITFAIENEAGKVPINALEKRDVRSLLSEAGLGGTALDIATDSLLDWTDEDDDPRPDGAESEHYTRAQIRPRNGAIRSLDELRAIRGFDAGTVARVSRIATVNFGRGPFRPEHASLPAIRIMMGEEGGAVDLVQRQRALEGQRTALSLSDDLALVGQPLTIRVIAKLPDGSRAQRRLIVVLTGRPADPYAVLEGR